MRLVDLNPPVTVYHEVGSKLNTLLFLAADSALNCGSLSNCVKPLSLPIAAALSRTKITSGSMVVMYSSEVKSP